MEYKEHNRDRTLTSEGTWFTCFCILFLHQGLFSSSSFHTVINMLTDAQVLMEEFISESNRFLVIVTCNVSWLLKDCYCPLLFVHSSSHHGVFLSLITSYEVITLPLGCVLFSKCLFFSLSHKRASLCHENDRSSFIFITAAVRDSGVQLRTFSALFEVCCRSESLNWSSRAE